MSNTPSPLNLEALSHSSTSSPSASIPSPSSNTLTLNTNQGNKMNQLSEEKSVRYDRQLRLWGEAGQFKLERR